LNKSASKTATNRHRVREGIQRKILSGKLRPGDRLGQQELAREFSVSQGVVRESLIELQFSGLVIAVDRLGIFVGEIGPEQIFQAWELREVLEGLAARRCCTHCSRFDLLLLRDLAERTFAAGTGGDPGKRGVLDREFHAQMVAMAGNEILARITATYRLIGLVVQARRDISLVHREHVAIVDAIEAGDAEEAERLARGHVRSSLAGLERAIREGRFAHDWVVGASGDDLVSFVSLSDE
jgi:DNA-binding GntR family transcriptional regulator